MSVRPLVSVLMPVYNAADTLESALVSLATQTLENFEVLLVDDGSADASVRLAAQIAASDARFRLIRRPHEGITNVLCEAASHARAPYIARMDADDFSMPQRLEMQLDFMERHTGLGLCGCLVRIGGARIGPGLRRYENWLNSLVSPEDHERELLVECPIAHPAFFLRRAAFEQVGGYRQESWPEDYDLVLRLNRAGFRMAKVDEVLLEWRHREDRLSMNDPRYSETAFRRIKRDHLYRTFLPPGRPFYQWGAGDVGKRWLREWGRARPIAAVDLHPRKIGHRIHGIPVISPELLPMARLPFVVVAVGARGARGEIRAWLTGRGAVELRDFVFLA